MTEWYFYDVKSIYGRYSQPKAVFLMRAIGLYVRALSYLRPKIDTPRKVAKLYPELFKQLESVRWDMERDIPWDTFDAATLSDEQAATIKMNAITEWSALPATEMFLRDNRGDSDFSAFMSIWFFEEQKHSLVLMEYLRRFRPDLVPTEEELHNVRFEFDPAPPLETLMLHFCGEIRLNHWYRRASDWHTEPVIKAIYTKLSQDEARHAVVLAQVLNPGYMAIGPTIDEATGKAKVASVPSAFGSLSVIQIAVGAPNAEGAKTSMTLETPSLNGLVYDAISC